jgi:hypothetical protein
MMPTICRLSAGRGGKCRFRGIAASRWFPGACQYRFVYIRGKQNSGPCQGPEQHIDCTPRGRPGIGQAGTDHHYPQGIRHAVSQRQSDVPTAGRAGSPQAVPTRWREPTPFEQQCATASPPGRKLSCRARREPIELPVQTSDADGFPVTGVPGLVAAGMMPVVACTLPASRASTPRTP